MNLECLLNIDTQEITRRIGELAVQDEPTLRVNCQEVSHQTDTSCLRLQEEFRAEEQTLKASASSAACILRTLVQALSANAGIFETKNSRADFASVCRAVIEMEELRVRLISRVNALSGVRRALAASVADANRALHFLSVAKASVIEEQRPFYGALFQKTKATYEQLTALDIALKEEQNVYMSLVEQHFSTFLQKARAAADFSHAGAALQNAELRALCGELLLLLERLKGSVFGRNCDEKIRNS